MHVSAPLCITGNRFFFSSHVITFSIFFLFRDYDSVIDSDGHDPIGKFEVKVSEIIQNKKVTFLGLFRLLFSSLLRFAAIDLCLCTYQIEKAFELFDIKSGMIPVKSDTMKASKLRVQLTWDQEGADGESEWLNGILRSSYRCFAADVDSMVREKLTASFKGLKLSIMSLSLQSFSIGNAAPFFNEMRILTTRRCFNWTTSLACQFLF